MKDAGHPAPTPDAWRYISRVPAHGRTFETLQQAIDATPDDGTLLLPQGVYGDAVKISKRRGLRIKGQGAGAYLLVRSKSKQPIVTIESSADITIENVLIARDVEWVQRDGFDSSGIGVFDSKRVTLRHLYVGTKDGTSVVITRSTVKGDDWLLENADTALSVFTQREDKVPSIALSSSRLNAMSSSILATGRDPCDWMLPLDKPISSFKVTGSRLEGNSPPNVCPQHAFGFTGNHIVRRYHDAPLYKLNLDRDNTVTDGTTPTSTLKLPSWRPDPALLDKHLEDFAQLPARSDFPPAAPGYALLCSDESAWFLFPDGPRLFDADGAPPRLAGCTMASAEELGLVHVLEHRVGWLKLARAPGWTTHESTGWMRESSVSAPCVVKSGERRLLSSVFNATSVEAINETTLAVAGTADLCGTGKKVERIALPAALRPGLRRSFTVSCSLQRTPALCVKQQPVNPVESLGGPDTGELAPEKRPRLLSTPPPPR